VDSYCSPQKQFLLLDLGLDIYHQGVAMLKLGVPAQELLALPLLGRARRFKSMYTSDELERLEACREEVRHGFDRLRTDYTRPGERVS
jgi:V/A-type H+-transporting ATPase subunit A